MLHVASEVCLVSRLRCVVGDGYLRSSFQQGQAEVSQNVKEVDLITTPYDLLPQRRVIEMGLTRASGDIFFCTRESFETC